jgi:hypothetical protein
MQLVDLGTRRRPEIGRVIAPIVQPTRVSVEMIDMIRFKTRQHGVDVLAIGIYSGMGTFERKSRYC